MSVRTGFDTGVFVLLASGQPEALELWNETVDGARDGVVSALMLFELARLGLRGALPGSFTEQALESIPQVCEVIGLGDPERIRQAATRAHGLGLSLADGLILDAFVASGCDEAFTTDRDLLRYTAQRPRLRPLISTRA